MNWIMLTSPHPAGHSLSPFITAARHWLRDTRLCWKARTNYPKKKNIFSVFRKIQSAVCHTAVLDVSLLSCVSQGCVHFTTETVSPFPGRSQVWLLIRSVGKVLRWSGANDVCLLFSSAMTFDIFTFIGHQKTRMFACLPCPNITKQRLWRISQKFSNTCRRGNVTPLTRGSKPRGRWHMKA